MKINELFIKYVSEQKNRERIDVLKSYGHSKVNPGKTSKRTLRTFERLNITRPAFLG